MISSSDLISWRHLLSPSSLISLPVLLTDWQRHYFVIGHYSSSSWLEDHVCASTLMCRRRETRSHRQHPVHQARPPFCAASLFLGLRLWNAARPPPPLTHANMHHNRAIHAGKCPLNGPPIPQLAANHDRILS